jgi:hypothetical protein
MGGDRRKTVICAILWFSDDILSSSALVVAVSDNYENRIFPITLIVIVLVLVLGGGFGYWYYASQKLNHIAKDAPPGQSRTS